MRTLTIYRRIFYNADCYTRGTVQKNVGVQVHSTGAVNSYLKRYVQPDDGRLGVNKNGNSHNRPGGTVCAGAYIGKLEDGTVAVYETLPDNMRVWLSGNGVNGNANRLGYFGFEICEDNLKDEEYFKEAVLNKSVLYTAYLCQQYGVHPGQMVNGRLPVLDHSELHAAGIASNHGDITSWLRKFGYSMKDYRKLVCEALDEGVDATIIDVSGEGEKVATVIRMGSKGTAVEKLQRDLETLGFNPGKIDGIFGTNTRDAVTAFQQKYGLKVDGIAGDNTLDMIEKLLNKEEPSTPEVDPYPQPQPIIDGVKNAIASVEAALDELKRLLASIN